MVDIADDASPRVSTMTRSGATPSRASRSSMHADRNRARPQQPADVLPERVVLADDEPTSLCHGESATAAVSCDDADCCLRELGLLLSSALGCRAWPARFAAFVLALLVGLRPASSSASRRAAVLFALLRRPSALGVLGVARAGFAASSRSRSCFCGLLARRLLLRQSVVGCAASRCRRRRRCARLAARSPSQAARLRASGGCSAVDRRRGRRAPWRRATRAAAGATGATRPPSRRCSRRLNAGAGDRTVFFTGDRRQVRLGQPRQRRRHAGRVVRQNLRRDHHDQLGLVLLRRLALEQQRRESGCRRCPESSAASSSSMLFIRPAIANVWPFVQLELGLGAARA